MSESRRGGWGVFMVTHMSDSQDEYVDPHSVIIATRLKRLSINKIKQMGEHWAQCYGEP